METTIQTPVFDFGFIFALPTFNAPTQKSKTKPRKRVILHRTKAKTGKDIRLTGKEEIVETTVEITSKPIIPKIPGKFRFGLPIAPKYPEKHTAHYLLDLLDSKKSKEFTFGEEKISISVSPKRKYSEKRIPGLWLSQLPLKDGVNISDIKHGDLVIFPRIYLPCGTDWDQKFFAYKCYREEKSSQPKKQKSQEEETELIPDIYLVPAIEGKGTTVPPDFSDAPQDFFEGSAKSVLIHPDHRMPGTHYSNLMDSVIEKDVETLSTPEPLSIAQELALSQLLDVEFPGNRANRDKLIQSAKNGQFPRGLLGHVFKTEMWGKELKKRREEALTIFTTETPKVTTFRWMEAEHYQEELGEYLLRQNERIKRWRNSNLIVLAITLEPFGIPLEIIALIVQFLMPSATYTPWME